MFTFLLITQTLIAASLVAVILMQRSEGGGLGVGGSSSGLMTARGASDFLTRSTAVLGGVFIVMSILLAAIAGVALEPAKVDTSLANEVAPLVPAQTGAPFAQPGATQPAQPEAQPQPQQNNAVPAVPLAQ